MTADGRLDFLARRDRDMLERLAQASGAPAVEIAAALLADTLQAVRDHRVLPSGRRLGSVLRRGPPGR